MDILTWVDCYGAQPFREAIKGKSIEEIKAIKGTLATSTSTSTSSHAAVSYAVGIAVDSIKNLPIKMAHFDEALSKTSKTVSSVRCCAQHAIVIRSLDPA